VTGLSVDFIAQLPEEMKENFAAVISIASQGGVFLNQ
jgi:hypothetical protein